MKTLNTILIIAFAGLLLVSCNEPDKKEQLKKLLVEREKLTDEINKLQAEISKSGDTSEEHANIHPVVISDLVTSTFKHYIDVQAKVDVDESVNVNPKGRPAIKPMIKNKFNIIIKLAIKPPDE